MQTIELPPNRWAAELAEFSAMHDGWLVSVDILAPNLGAQPEVQDLPLVGVVSEPGSNGGLITISAARSDGSQITHAIQKPSRVRIERTSEGADVAMQIESAEGTT